MSLVPECALQSTSMPALHRRNVPNCRPMAVGGMRKCSAGACPPLGSGWAQQNPPCRFAVPNHNSRFSCRLVPAGAPAGMSDCYENSYPLPPNSSFSRKRESRGEGWRQPHPNTSNDQVSFSYLGVPAPAGMGDWYENALNRLSSAPANPSIRHSREGRNPGEGRPAHPFHMESLWAVPPQPTVLVRSQFANAQHKLRSNLNSYRTAGFRSSIAARS